MIGFGRLLTAMVTPFGGDLQLDLNQAGLLAERLVESGSNGVIVAGILGEAPALTFRERLELFRVVADGIGGRATVIAETGGCCTEESAELTHEAEKTGVDGIIVAAPYYSIQPQEGLFRHFKAVAESARLPVMLCNDPGRTGANIAPETLGRLSEVENIVAVNESSGDIRQTVCYRELARRDLSIYCGDDSLTLPMMAAGAVGVVSLASHLVGRRLKEMIDTLAAGKFDSASRINLELAPIFRITASNPTMVKAAVNMLGFDVGGVRLPLVEANGSELEMLRDCLREIGLL